MPILPDFDENVENAEDSCDPRQAAATVEGCGRTVAAWAKVMQVIPAIDLRGGCCVRLRQGDYEQETVFGSDPVAMAAHWEAEGATRLHLVDLDGAKAGHPSATSKSSGRSLAAWAFPASLAVVFGIKPRSRPGSTRVWIGSSSEPRP